MQTLIDVIKDDKMLTTSAFVRNQSKSSKVGVIVEDFNPYVAIRLAVDIAYKNRFIHDLKIGES